jgi:hypothetical protein
VTRRRRGPHQADSPSAALEIAEAAADLEAVIGEELRSDSPVIDAFGDADEGEGREAVPLLDRELQAKRLEALLEGIGLFPMTCVAGVEPFLQDEAEWWSTPGVRVRKTKPARGPVGTRDTSACRSTPRRCPSDRCQPVRQRER